MAAGKGPGNDFEKMIHEARDRKKNEVLAARIFGKDRRSSTPQPQKPSLGGPLANRVGVKKRVASTGPRGAPSTSLKSLSARTGGNIDSDWTHDLHERHSAPSTPRGGHGVSRPNAASNSLASRITNPLSNRITTNPTTRNAPPPAGAASLGPATRVRNNARRTAQVAQALIRTELSAAPAHAPREPAAAAPSHAPRAPAAIVTSAGPAGANRNNNNNNNNGSWPPTTANNNNRNGRNSGRPASLSIRGLATGGFGPAVVMAQNFAPGTTAADIESAVTPVGGLVQSCRLLKTDPIVIAEIVFESREGADRVIETFDNQTADGRLIHVYYKAGGGATPATTPGLRTGNSAASNAPSGPRGGGNRNNGNVVDGSLGFDEPMEMDQGGYVIDTMGRSRQSEGLYSDGLVQRKPDYGNGYRQQQRSGYGGGGGGGGRRGGLGR